MHPSLSHHHTAQGSYEGEERKVSLSDLQDELGPTCLVLLVVQALDVLVKAAERGSLLRLAVVKQRPLLTLERLPCGAYRHTDRQTDRHT
jgi:hypothetical protein